MVKTGVVLLLFLATTTYLVTIFTDPVQSENHVAADSVPDLQNQHNLNDILETDGKRADIVMPTKSSRPGCEVDNRCYMPSKVVVGAGDSVTWKNEDSAFHSVTSGTYGSPDGLFDSGHLEPEETFIVTFEKKGSYTFFCTLHPWMEGNVQVTDQ